MSERFLVLGGEVIVLVQNLHGLVNSDGRRKQLVSTADGQHHTRTSTWTPDASSTNLGITSFPPWIFWESFGGGTRLGGVERNQEDHQGERRVREGRKALELLRVQGLGFPRIRTGTPSQRPP